MNVGGLFDGVGLLAYGLHLAGHEHAWLCEVDPWRRTILERRWPGVPVHTDVRAVGAATAGRVDIIAGGFPCKGASTAGKQEGFGHPETVLWREMARAVGELRPRYVVVENVANILALHDGAVWGEVLGDLAALGYDVTWDCVPAGAVGAPHLRDRVFAIAAHADSARADAHAATGGPRPATGERAGAAPDSDGPDGERDGGQRREPDGRPDAGGGGHGSAADTEPVGLAGRAPVRQGRPETQRRRAAAADSNRDGVREQPESEPGRRGAPVAPEPRSVAVEWGNYEPAIRRWEAVHGTAPEPLVRRMDDRGAARVERSRLSALGDGVQVQVGYLVGCHLVSLESARLEIAA